MDIVVVICFALVVVWNLLGILAGGGNPGHFVDPTSVFVTIGGGITATMLGNGLPAFQKIPALMGVVLGGKQGSETEMIVTLISFAEKARREGLLVLEDDLGEVDEEFLKKGLQLVVDGTDPELVKAILSAEVDEIESRHDRQRKIFDDMGSFFPAWGMIGTLIGLVIMLRGLGSGGGASQVGSGMAVALITTYYGSVMANGVALPLASKLQDLNDDEMLIKNVMLDGILAIQAGDNPRVVQEKLTSYLPPTEKKKVIEQIGEK